MCVCACVCVCVRARARVVAQRCNAARNLNSNDRMSCIST